MTELLCKICEKPGNLYCLSCGSVNYCLDHACHHFTVEQLVRYRKESINPSDWTHPDVVNYEKQKRIEEKKKRITANTVITTGIAFFVLFSWLGRSGWVLTGTAIVGVLSYYGWTVVLYDHKDYQL